MPVTHGGLFHTGADARTMGLVNCLSAHTYAAVGMESASDRLWHYQAVALVAQTLWAHAEAQAGVCSGTDDLDGRCQP